MAGNVEIFTTSAAVRKLNVSISIPNVSQPASVWCPPDLYLRRSLSRSVFFSLIRLSVCSFGLFGRVFCFAFDCLLVCFRFCRLVGWFVCLVGCWHVCSFCHIFSLSSNGEKALPPLADFSRKCRRNIRAAKRLLTDERSSASYR